MIKLTDLLNESTTDLVFTDKGEYAEFKKWIDSEPSAKGVIVKDMGKDKPASDIGGWYVRLDNIKMTNFYGRGWNKTPNPGLKDEFPSVIFS